MQYTGTSCFILELHRFLSQLGPSVVSKAHPAGWTHLHEVESSQLYENIDRQTHHNLVFKLTAIVSTCTKLMPLRSSLEMNRKHFDTLPNKI